MTATILTADQEQVLALLAADRPIAHAFYLSGGTALAEYYLHHRLSEDLDFFSEQEVDTEGISARLKSIQTPAGIRRITFEQSFNRNLFFLELDNSTIKTEFTFYPFPRIEQGRKVGALAIDSLLDIAVNKIFTIYQKPRSRDFIDLFCILQKQTEWTLDALREKAQIKFDYYVDPIQLAGQYVKSKTLKDYPTLRITLNEKTWQNFFMQEAEKLAAKQLSQ